MSTKYRFKRACWLLLLSTSWFATIAPSGSQAQETPGQPVHFRVSETTQRLEMLVNTSRILTLEHDVPRMLVNNPSIVRATPLSPNQVQLSAVTAGVTQLNLWDANEKLYTVDVVVSADARQLENLLAMMFPTAQLTVQPLSQSVVISGYVPNPDMVSRIHRVAEDYYPNVIDNIKVAGVQTVLLHTKVMEISRTNLRTCGVDWANVSNGGSFVIQGVSGLIAQATASTVATGAGGGTVRFGVVDGNNGFFGFLDLLRRNNLAKVLAEPTLVATSGRPASFHSGGEFPILVPQGLGNIAVEYRQYGTRVDYVPFVLGNGRVRLEVRPTVSEVDPSRSVSLGNSTVPALRSRWVDTAVEMRSGQTLALAGLLQTRVESENRGIPWLADLPWAGAAFRRVTETNNEIELLILVTPEFVDAMDPHEVPCGGPGLNTTRPNDVELYWRGYLEVPVCGPDGRSHPAAGPAPIMQSYPYPGNMPGEAIPQGRLPDPQASRLGQPSYQPVSAPNRQNPYMSNMPNSQRATGYQTPAATQPGLIGPRGYDDLK
jgi:pilus assembly protein CpaC